jgi:hypothetical protein
MQSISQQVLTEKFTTHKPELFKASYCGLALAAAAAAAAAAGSCMSPDNSRSQKLLHRH